MVLFVGDALLKYPSHLPTVVTEPIPLGVTLGIGMHGIIVHGDHRARGAVGDETSVLRMSVPEAYQEASLTESANRIESLKPPRPSPCQA